MRYEKIISTFSFLFLLFVGGYSFLNFSAYGNEIKESATTFFPQVFNYFSIEEDPEKTNGIIKEETDGGTLTRRGVIEETNKQRENFSLSLLEENVLLNKIAEEKINDMFENNYFAHISPEGVGASDIAEKIGYDYLLIGDNLAMGFYRDDEDVVSEWMKSPGHRRNILNKKYREIGVATGKGEFEGKETWMAVQVFGMPSSACPSVDEDLLFEIQKIESDAENLISRKESLERAIDEAEKGSEEHTQKVKEYNEVIKEYNALVPVLDELINEYNKQVEIREECIHE